MVKAYILSNLQERLELSEAQYLELLPLVNQLHDDRHSFARKKGQALRELSRLLASGKATEARLVELLAELRAIQKREPATILGDLEAIDAVLTPVQQARFRVYETEVERKIRELMGRRQRGRDGERRQPPRQRNPRPPG
jgi:Spy/CpxP family protein refolding chaperone